MSRHGSLYIDRSLNRMLVSPVVAVIRTDLLTISGVSEGEQIVGGYSRLEDQGKPRTRHQSIQK